MARHTIEILNRLEELNRIRSAVSLFIKDEVDEITAGRIILAIDEAVSNIIIHGYKDVADGTIELSMNADDTVLSFTISDNAPFFDPLTVAPPDIDSHKAGGLGVDIYRQIMDVHHEKNETGGNRLILTKARSHENKS
jgi:serine/threonine-protein kinase RsbW